MNRTPAAAALALLLAASLVACGSDGGDGAEPSGDSAPQTATTDEGAGEATDGTDAAESRPDAELSVEGEVIGTADAPIMALPRTAPDGSQELWVAERAGTIRRFAVADDGTIAATGGAPLLDITDQTTTEAERGLLSIAFSPGGDELVVSSTDADGNSSVQAYPVEGDALGEPRQLFAIDQPYPNHNGGHVVFGPDDQLWFGLGDGGAADDPENRAQDPDTELGKIIRLDPASGDAEIVVSGVRNPWRFEFDEDGSLWIADVGQNALEEIDHLPADEIDGANLGWSGYEGSEPYLDGDGRRPDDPVMPVFEYGRDGGNCSITGGYPYHGEAIPALQGAYVFADYCAGQVRAVFLGDDGAFEREVDLGIAVEAPISFARDGDGELLVLSQGGDVERIVPAS